MTPFTRLVRFRDEHGSIQYGELGTAIDDLANESLNGKVVRIYHGRSPWDNDFTLTNEKKTVKEVLCPLENTPIFMCIGLNYRKHADEVKVPYPKYPSIFMKPPDALNGPFDDVIIPRICETVDYEAEVCVILGKDCKDIGDSEDVSEYILAYCVGNDVSSRDWQGAERSGSASRAKSFDGFAPIGPCLVSKDIITDPSQLRVETFVNGELRQSGNASDMIFDIPEIIRRLSQGVTLRKGTVIMTGTPSGVAAFMKPPAWLKDGDIVEIRMQPAGTMRNRIVIR